VLDTKLENTYVKEYMADFSLPRAVNPIIDYTVSFVDEDKTYSRKIDFSQNYLLPISNISNGHF
jgi:hypothetical protein